MAGTTAFPTALDTFPDILPDTQEDAIGFEHDTVHNNEAAAIAALQEKVGIDASADPTSLDARVTALEVRRRGDLPVHLWANWGSGVWRPLHNHFDNGKRRRCYGV